MSVSRFAAAEMSLGGLLSEGYCFVVPIHQRDFRWTEDEIEQFFTDIGEAAATGQSEYFIGLMVFMKGDSREFIILDGQQRIATTMIILASIRTWLRQRDFEMDANQIQSHFISIRRLGEDNLEPRLVLNETNNRMLDDYVIHDAPVEEVVSRLEGLSRYDPNRPLLEAIILTKRKIEEMIDNVENREEKAKILIGFVNYLLDNVKLVRFSVPSDSNAFTIFETLNDRGLDLSILDLVKNHLFGLASQISVDRSRARLREMQRTWNQMMSHLTNVPADNYLKAYWTSRHGRTQKARLFPNFKAAVNSWRDVRETASDMLVAAEQYVALGSPYDPIWPEISPDSRRRISALDVLGARQVHPVLLSALAKFDVRELERLLHLLEVLIVRYQLIGGGRTGRLEISCAGLAADIYHERVSSAVQAFEAIQDIYPSNRDFRISFQQKQERDSKKIRYVLAELESESRRREGQALGAELRTIESLTVEHVLPKKPSGQWDAVIQQDLDLTRDCTYALGNVCLLSQVNRALGNRPFAEKKLAYQRSSLHLTNMIAGYQSWTRTQIENRQRHMANLALSAWAFT